MKFLNSKTLLKSALMLGVVTGFSSLSAQTLPKSTDLVSDMGFGYNLGNTMEVPNNPTLWGNVVPSKTLIDSVKAAGFNTLRIPTAWFTHSDTTTNTINTTWLDTIKTIVDYAVANDMYVILNSHWDNGWLEDKVFDGTHPDRNNNSTTTDSAIVRKRQYDYWVQIANKFKSYDEHVIFAGANEPGVNDPWGSGADYFDEGQLGFGDERMKILQAYHQAFIDAVRSTGGNNTTRTLVVQAPRTEFTKTDLLKTYFPTDPTGTGYMMAEIHFYPYQFALMSEDASWGKVFYYWGDEAHPTDTERNASWGGPSYVDSVFTLMKDKFTSQNIPVVVGEFGAMKRLNAISGDDLARHLRSRALFYGKVASSAKANGLIPVLWDTGAENDGNMTVIQRQSGASEMGKIFDYEVLNAMRKAYGLDTLAGNSIDALVGASLDNGNKSLSVAYDYTQNDSAYSSIRFTPPVKNLSQYKGMSILAKVEGQAAQVEGEYGYFSMDLVTMSGSGWAWTDVHFGAVAFDTWKTYNFTFTSVEANEDKDNQVLYLTDATQVNQFIIQSYMKYFTGSVQIDQILLIKQDNSVDTLEAFHSEIPEYEGAIISAEIVATPDSVTPTVNIPSAFSGLKFSYDRQKLMTSFESSKAGASTISLINLEGKVIARESFSSKIGRNEVGLNVSYHGPALLVIDQEGSRLTAILHLK